MKPITYLSDQAHDYCEALDPCKSLAELTALLEEYHTLFPDALAAIPKDQEEFEVFLKGLKKERRGRFAGETFVKRFGPVLMPATAMEVSFVAHKYSVPWGCAFIRLKEAGYIVFDSAGVARWVQPTPQQPAPAAPAAPPAA